MPSLLAKKTLLESYLTRVREFIAVEPNSTFDSIRKGTERLRALEQEIRFELGVVDDEIEAEQFERDQQEIEDLEFGADEDLTYEEKAQLGRPR